MRKSRSRNPSQPNRRRPLTPKDQVEERELDVDLHEEEYWSDSLVVIKYISFVLLFPTLRICQTLLGKYYMLCFKYFGSFVNWEKGI
jgi:hypothetical protein